MTGLLYRVRVAVLAHTFAYVPLALWLAYEDRAGITFLIIPPLTFTFAAIWLGWRAWVALGDAWVALASWHALRQPAPAHRPISLADYMPGATQPPANRAA